MLRQESPHKTTRSRFTSDAKYIDKCSISQNKLQPTCENGNGEVETEEDGSDEEKAGKNEHETPAPPDVLIRIVHEIQKQFQNKRLLEVNMTESEESIINSKNILLLVTCITMHLSF